MHLQSAVHLLVQLRRKLPLANLLALSDPNAPEKKPTSRHISGIMQRRGLLDNCDA
jgi:hypothetical protein